MKITVVKEKRKDHKNVWMGTIYDSAVIANYACSASSEIEVIEALAEYVRNLFKEVHIADLELNQMWLDCPEEPPEKANTETKI